MQFLYARETLDNLIAVGEELNVPGTESRIAEFRRLESQSDKFSLHALITPDSVGGER